MARRSPPRAPQGREGQNRHQGITVRPAKGLLIAEVRYEFKVVYGHLELALNLSTFMDDWSLL